LQNIGHYVDLYRKNQQTRGSYEVKIEYKKVFIKLYEMKYLNYYIYTSWLHCASNDVEHFLFTN